MHQCVIKWHINSVEHSLHAHHVWPAMALSGHIWATIATTLLSVLGSPHRQAISAWLMHMKVQQQHALRGLATQWATPGVSIFLEIMVRRKARAEMYIERMRKSAMLTYSASISHVTQSAA